MSWIPMVKRGSHIGTKGFVRSETTAVYNIGQTRKSFIIFYIKEFKPFLCHESAGSGFRFLKNISEEKNERFCW